MNEIDAYLEQVCGRLTADPAEIADIREELRSHIEDRIQTYRAGGSKYEEAARLSLNCLGEPEKLHFCLDRVHQGDAWWIRRMKGLVVGVLLGCLLGLIMPLGGPLESLARFSVISFGTGAARFLILLNALIIGGVIGALSAGGRSLLLGWLIGSFVWLVEYVMAWIAGLNANSMAVDSLQMLNAVLLAPLIGGSFGIAIGLGSSAFLSLFSRQRPEIR